MENQKHRYEDDRRSIMKKKKFKVLIELQLLNTASVS